MNFCVLTEEEFRAFGEGHPEESFFQTVENGKIRACYGSKLHYLGVKKGKKVVAAGMFTESDCMFHKKRLYAPQGFLADYRDMEVLRVFTKGLKEYGKKMNAMFVKIDPNVIYILRDAEGNPKKDWTPADDVIANLKKLGYKHFGFTKDYRFSQSRWNFRVPLDVPYEELKAGFSKSTRKNIDKCYEKGVRIRRGGREDIEIMTELLQSTAERKHFRFRDTEYYHNMYEVFGDLMQIYIAYVDSDLYLRGAKERLKKEEENHQLILEKMEHEKVGNKLKSELSTSDKLLEKLKEEVKDAEDFKKEFPKGKDIGGLLSIKSGPEYVTLTSGFLVEFKRFMPKYVMYNEHIKDAYTYGFPYVNFYGISGVFDSSNPIYGVYEFKRGFGGEVVELVGEFTYKISNTYYIYNLFRHLKILYREITKK